MSFARLAFFLLIAHVSAQASQNPYGFETGECLEVIRDYRITVPTPTENTAYFQAEVSLTVFNEVGLTLRKAHADGQFDPYTTHIKLLERLAPIHMNHAWRGIYNLLRGSELDDRLDIWHLFKDEVGERATSQSMSYHWWIWFNYRLSILMSPDSFCQSAFTRSIMGYPNLMFLDKLWIYYKLKLSELATGYVPHLKRWFGWQLDGKKYAFGEVMDSFFLFKLTSTNGWYSHEQTVRMAESFHPLCADFNRARGHTIFSLKLPDVLFLRSNFAKGLPYFILMPNIDYNLGIAAYNRLFGSCVYQFGISNCYMVYDEMIAPPEGFSRHDLFHALFVHLMLFSEKHRPGKVSIGELVDNFAEYIRPQQNPICLVVYKRLRRIACSRELNEFLTYHLTHEDSEFFRYANSTTNPHAIASEFRKIVQEEWQERFNNPTFYRPIWPTEFCDYRGDDLQRYFIKSLSNLLEQTYFH